MEGFKTRARATCILYNILFSPLWMLADLRTTIVCMNSVAAAGVSI